MSAPGDDPQGAASEQPATADEDMPIEMSADISVQPVTALEAQITCGIRQATETEPTDPVSVETIQGNMQTTEVNVETTEENVETTETNAGTTEVNMETTQANAETTEVNAEITEMNVETNEVNMETNEMNVDTTEMNEQTTEVNMETNEMNVETTEINVESAEANVDTTESNIETTEEDVFSIFEGVELTNYVAISPNANRACHVTAESNPGSSTECQIPVRYFGEPEVPGSSLDPIILEQESNQHHNFMQSSILPELLTSAVQPSVAALNLLSALTAAASQEGGNCGDMNSDEGGDRETDQENSIRMATFSDTHDVEIPTVDSPNEIENIIKKKTGSSKISDPTIFSEPTEYEEEFLLTENMVNNYTFSDESKSSSESSSDDVGEQIDKTTSETNDNVMSSNKDKDAVENKATEMETNMNKSLEAELTTTTAEKVELINESLDEDILLNVSGELDSDTEDLQRNKKTVSEKKDTKHSKIPETDSKMDLNKGTEDLKTIKDTNKEICTKDRSLKVEQNLKLDKDIENLKAKRDITDEIMDPKDGDINQEEEKQNSNIDKKINATEGTDKEEEMEIDYFSQAGPSHVTVQKQPSPLPGTSKETVENEILETVNEESTAGPLSMERPEPDGDSSDTGGLPSLGDALGLLSECRALERDDDDEEEEDINNDDDESNQMAPDSSEVESNANNDDKDIDQSDVEMAGQSEHGSKVQSEDDIDESLDSVARTAADSDENTIGLSISSVTSERDVEKAQDEMFDKLKGSPTPHKDTLESAASDKIEVDLATADKTGVIQESSGKRTDSFKDAKSGSDKNDAPQNKPDTPHKPDEENVVGTPTKTKRLEIGKPSAVMNIVELEESSSDSDVQETKMAPPSTPKRKPKDEATTHVNLPKDIDIMSASGGTSCDIISTPAENVISGLPAASPSKKAAPRINTSEISIKTQKMLDSSTITIPDEADRQPEKKALKKEKKEPKFSLEVFNVDSDEDTKSPPQKLSAIELQKAREGKKCVNYLCAGGGREHLAAPSHVLSYYEVKRGRRGAPLVCRPCEQKVTRRAEALMEGFRSKQPLLSLAMDKECQQLVEISDSESDSDADEPAAQKDRLDEATAKLFEDHLADVLNETWSKYGITEQLKRCEEELKEQMDNLQKGCDEIDRLLADEQRTTDKIRNELYASFASEVKTLEPIEIIDVPESMLPLTPPSTPRCGDISDGSDVEGRRSKRHRRAVDYSEQTKDSSHYDTHTSTTSRDADSPVIVDVKLAPKPGDDTADVSVVQLSAEAAPADLPPPGELTRPPPRAGDLMFAVRQSYVGSWALARVLEIWPVGSPPPGKDGTVTHAKIRFEHKLKGAAVKYLSGKELAYMEPSKVRLVIGTRVIALFKRTVGNSKREVFYSGIIAEMPTPVNNYRYLVFFDDGYAQYVRHAGVRVVCESAARVWEDVHADSRDFLRQYVLSYPERPMVRLQRGQALKTEWNGKWWQSRVAAVDASLAQVQFDVDGRLEWIYRGSSRLAPLYLALQAAERQRPRGLTRLHRPAAKGNMPYVEYTRSDEQDTSKPVETPAAHAREEARQCQQRAVAKKSTGAPGGPGQRPGAPKPLDDLMTRVVYYSPKSAVKPYKMVAHVCSPACRRSDVLPLKELKTYNPLTRPLLTGWERQILRFKGKKVVMYRAPCGRRLRDMSELHRYLRAVDSDCSVDLFDYNPSTHCLAEFVLNKCYVHKKDLSHGKENVPVPCVNYYDDTLPEFCLYNTERTPTSGVPLNLDPEFLCGCDCEDDCQDKSKCACWKMTLEGARTIGRDSADVGYHFKRLLEPLPSGIYECNSRCHCKQTCLNRVAQHPLQLKLQVFKTYNRGWGIRALNDIPKGAFLCVYAGNLLTDATANLDGINEGDEYLAELDFIEVAERMKEGYESDVREEKESEESSSSEEEEPATQESRDEDADFRPDRPTRSHDGQFTKSLRKRGEKKEKEKEEKKKEGEGETRDDDQFITISDDEEVREPSRFTATADLDEDDYEPRHLSVRARYGADEKCYIVDAKVQGNIGRYLNHSCSPNVFVQNVFVDTHDPRFPWVAFFALSHVQAGSELTWNYNYDVGSVPDKIMYCKCGAPNCRGRLL